MVVCRSTDIISKEDLDKASNSIVQVYTANTTHHHPSKRVLVAIAGRPGSGKSTASQVIADEVRRRLPGVGVCVMPMDGYHLYRSELRAMSNAEEAFARRGAEWTFNPGRMHRDLLALRTRGQDGGFEDVHVPSFDHAVGDPCEGGICIAGSIGVVLVEGNYMLYRGTPEWAAVNGLFDVGIFIACAPEICTERLCRRHMEAWKISREEAVARAQGSDTTNGNLVDTTVGNSDVVIHSVEMPRTEAKL